LHINPPSNLERQYADTETQASRGWSQEQLATISGLSTRTIQRLERGQPASLETMNTLAAVFEVDLSQLTDQKEAEMPNYVASHTEAEEAIAFAKVRRIKKFYLPSFNMSSFCAY
jgi:transcriptional regulator with XRE-family HTH domain